jgi:hypothetical protein
MPPIAGDCVVSAFGPFSPCSVTCGTVPGTETRTRTVLSPKRGAGADCPPLVNKAPCLPTVAVCPEGTDTGWAPGAPWNFGVVPTPKATIFRRLSPTDPLSVLHPCVAQRCSRRRVVCMDRQHSMHGHMRRRYDDGNTHMQQTCRAGHHTMPRPLGAHGFMQHAGVRAWPRWCVLLRLCQRLKLTGHP